MKQGRPFFWFFYVTFSFSLFGFFFFWGGGWLRRIVFPLRPVISVTVRACRDVKVFFYYLFLLLLAGGMDKAREQGMGMGWDGICCVHG
jgi:hypothetical protein